MKTVLFIGPSGSGKDTQSNILVEKYPREFEQITTGDVLRIMHQLRITEGEEAYSYLVKGKWVPNRLMYRLLSKWLHLFGENESWLLIGAVREEEQVDMLDEVLKEHNRKLDKVIHFTLDAETVVERLKNRKSCPLCGKIYHSVYNPEKEEGKCDDDGNNLIVREDDNPAAIRVRLQEYERTIKPILEKYNERGILVNIDASRRIEEINEEVEKVLDIKGKR
ncbi:MAG TPA: adenylate kinase [bacterium]|nr:adenylate kinase [bacterium]